MKTWRVRSMLAPLSLAGLVLLVACGGSKACPEGSEVVGSSCQPIDASASDASVDAASDAADAGATDAAADASSCEALCPDDGNECTRCDDSCALMPLTNVVCADGEGVCRSGDCWHVQALYQVGTGAGTDVYLVPVDGSQPPRRLSPMLPAGRRLESWWFSDDWDQFIYLADQDTRRVNELYAMPIDGSAEPIKLNLSLEAGDQVTSTVQFQGDRVLYMTRNRDLYSAAIDGSGGRKLNDGPVESFKVMASGRVVYSSAEGSARDLFLTDVSGRPPTRINPPLPSGARIRDFQAALDEGALYYLADQDTVGIPELYRFDFARGAVTKVNPPLASGGTVHIFRPLDAGRVLYRAEQATAGVAELFLADAGGDVTRLNAALVAGGQVGDFVAELRPAPDGVTSLVGDHVLYTADQETPGVYELYAARLDGGGVVKLNGVLPTGGELRAYLFSPGGEHVIYMADQDTPGVFELYSVRLDGSGRSKLNGPLTPGGQVLAALPTSYDDWVLYMADEENDEVIEAFAARIDGSERMKLNPPLVAGGDVYDAVFSNLPAVAFPLAWTLYTADQDVDEVIEVYASRLDGTRHVKLSAPLRLGEQVDFAYQIPLPL